jgi:phosphoribosylformylglycinamidine synthase
LAGGAPERVHVNRLLENPRLVDDFEILCLPGGFSYGDDLAAGRILASQLRHYLADQVRAFCDADKLVLGICNGFQVLIQTGILLPGDDGAPRATLTDNDCGRFEDRWVELRVASAKCVFLSGIERMYLPIAHAEGKFVARNAQTFEQLDQQGQLVLRYTNSAGAETGNLSYPDNPNGSQGNVAGLCDASGRVFGLMPHPERFIDPTNHPRWTRQPVGEAGEGLRIFQNAVRYFA